MELVAYAIALAIIAIVSLCGVLTHHLKDRIVQRIGLSMACIGATVRIYEMIVGTVDHTNARYLLTYGVALFAACTFVKYYRGQK